MGLDGVSDDTSNSDEVQIVVGQPYRGGIVMNVDEETSKRPNGLTRLRTLIQLDSGMILVEDKFIDTRKKIEGDEFEDSYLPDIPSPIQPLDSKKKKKKKKKKITTTTATTPKRRTSNASSKDDNSLSSSSKKKGARTKQPPPSLPFSSDSDSQADDFEERTTNTSKEKLSEEQFQQSFQSKEGATSDESLTSTEGQLDNSSSTLSKEKFEPEGTKNEEYQRQKELDEKQKRQQQQQQQQKKEEEAAAAENKRREQLVKASQEALQKRKEAIEKKKRMERRQAKWKPQSVWVHSPESSMVPCKDKGPTIDLEKQGKDSNNTDSSENDNASRNIDLVDTAMPDAIWSFGADTEPDETFQLWKPQEVILHPPGKNGKNIRSKNDTSNENTTTPSGLWAFAPGIDIESCRDDDNDGEDWKPYKEDNLNPTFLLFPPGVVPTDANTGKELKVQGQWTLPAGETNFPPLPLPKTEWKAKQSVMVHPQSKPQPSSDENLEASEAALRGQWMITDGDDCKPCGDDEWRVTEVVVYPEGTLPTDSLIDDGKNKSQGTWGLAPGALPQPDGRWDSKDVWFFAPGDAPKDEASWQPQGIWTYPPDSGRSNWPPLVEPQDDWEPKAVWVFPPSNMPDEEDEEWKPTGVWSFSDDPLSEDEAEKDWQPYQVMAYATGQEPENLNSVDIQGVWGVSPGAKKDDSGEWEASHMLFSEPKKELPENCRVQGVWTVYSSPSNCNSDHDSESWPPKSNKKQPEKEDKISTTPRVACIRPRARPRDTTDTASNDANGVWSFGNADEDENEPDWLPQNVLLHETESLPVESIANTPHGLWGYLTDPATDSKEEDNQLCCLLPGQEPPQENWIAKGIWTIEDGEECVDFESFSLPKCTPEKVIVYPKKKVPKHNEKNGPRCGVWSYAPGKKVMDAGKKPITIDLYEEGREPTELPSRHGHWGYAPGAQPDNCGNFQPEDLWIFAPGEKPPTDVAWQPKGVWCDPTPTPRVKVDKKASTKKNDVCLKEEKPQTIPRKRQFEKSAWVYPSQEKAPVHGEKKNPQGCWAQLPGGASTDNSGEPQEILYYKKGHEPKDLDLVPHGIFGYAAGSQPDEFGLWSPKDMLFFPPGEEPPPDLQNEGVWTYPLGSRSETTFWYKFEGSDIVHYKKTTIFYMNTSVSFTQEFRK